MCRVIGRHRGWQSACLPCLLRGLPPSSQAAKAQSVYGWLVAHQVTAGNRRWLQPCVAQYRGEGKFAESAVNPMGSLAAQEPLPSLRLKIASRWSWLFFAVVSR